MTAPVPSRLPRSTTRGEQPTDGGGDGGREVEASIRATYDSALDGLPYHVTTQVGDHTVTFQEPVADPFVRTTVVVSWRDVLRELVHRRRVRVTVVVGGNLDRVHDVLELDDQTLVAGRSRNAAFHSRIVALLAEQPGGGN